MLQPMGSQDQPVAIGPAIQDFLMAADGKVIRARIISSDLNAPRLEKRLISRIKLFRFSNRNVDTVTVTYPIDFLPSWLL